MAATTDCPPRDLPDAADDIRLGTLYGNVALRVRQRSGDDAEWNDMVGHFGWETLPTSAGGHCLGPTFHRVFPSGQKVMYGLHTAIQIMEIVVHCKKGGVDNVCYVHPCMLQHCVAVVGEEA